MSTREKVIAKLLALPTDMRFSDVQKILEWHGYVLSHAKGSHFMFRKEGSPRLVIPKKDGQTVKRRYLKDVIEVLELGE